MEIEVKVAVESLPMVAEKARRLGFEEVEPRHFEANTLYDFPGRPLSVAGCLLRVRECRGTALLTFKGRLVQHERYKIRPEKETVCQSAESLRGILEGIGLRPFFRYEKFRTEFRAPSNTLLCLDEMPFGPYLELEGEPEGIEAVASALSIDPESYIRRSYADLYGEHCRKLGMPFGDILFPPDHDRT